VCSGPERSDGGTREFIEELPERDEGSVHIYTVETPNGYHIITLPFNYNDWEPPVEYDDLDTVGMVHIARVDNRVSVDKR